MRWATGREEKARMSLTSRPAYLGESIVISIDSSSSMNVRDVRPSRIEAAKRAASVFVRAAAARGRPVLFGVVEFHRDAIVILDLSEDVGLVESAISLVRPLGKASNVVKALGEAYHLLKWSPPGYGKRVLLLTDGDVGDSGLLPSAVFLYQANGIRLDSIVVSGSARSKISRVLEAASATGGEALPAESLEEAVKAALRLGSQ